MINELYKDWQCKRVTDIEMAVFFFLYFYEKKYPNIKLRKSLESGEDFKLSLDRFVFKKIKFKAIVALKKWRDGEWAFKLEPRILLPKEILYYQAQGIRPVTLKIQDTFEPILHKDDCLEFFVHDLEHGYMFFHDDELKKMQLKFFKGIYENIDLRVWAKYSHDKRFQYRFNYLISDMNTHLEHYKSYLYAMLEPSDRKYFETIFE